jgi:tetratricopeptide (TPR) repeat protein
LPELQIAPDFFSGLCGFAAVCFPPVALEIVSQVLENRHIVEQPITGAVIMKTKAQVFTVACAVLFILSLYPTDIEACTMIKITVKGKTLVGNNEDFTNADTRIWFEPGTGIRFGVVYVGYSQLSPEGGVNEAGLVFDAFGVSNKPLRDTAGKLPVFEMDLKRRIMQECSTVEQVKALIDKYNLYFWSHAVWVFIDKPGNYLVVDGDSVTLGSNRCFVQTNFRQCEIKDEKEISCPRYLKAMALLKNHCETSTEFCTSLMDSVHQQTTLYTTVYDLEAGTIDLYYFHNYTKGIRFSIKEELKKGKRVLRIPELFPDVINPGYQGMLNLKATFDSLAFYLTPNDSARRLTIMDHLRKQGYTIHVLGNHGYEFLRQGDIQKAIGMFTLLIEFYPQMPHGYDFVGEAYMENKEYDVALANYKRSVELYPANVNGRQRIDLLNELMRTK